MQPGVRNPSQMALGMDIRGYITKRPGLRPAKIEKVTIHFTALKQMRVCFSLFPKQEKS